MRAHRTAIAATAAASAAAVLLLGGALRESGSAKARSVTATRTVPLASATERQVRALQSRVRARPGDAQALAQLALAYEQRARETADPAYLAKADGVVRRSLRRAPQNATATLAAASLALSRHEFRRALALGRRARRLAPEAAEPYAIVGDALVELGRHDEAFRVFDAMAREEPGVAAYARVAYGRELLGNRRGAVEAMRLAVDAATGSGEPAAWANVELGKLQFGAGRLQPAARRYRAALRAFPGYPFALDALAAVEAARGRLSHAERLSRRAVAAVPLPQFARTLGDVLTAVGRLRAARDAYALVSAVERLLRANGVRGDLEIAQSYVDRGVRLRHALELARRAHAGQPSLEADDVLAWALARNGRCVEALRFSQRSLRLGTRDAAKFFHRGMIERCLGRHAAARAWFRRSLALNPYFSPIWTPVARKLS